MGCLRAWASGVHHGHSEDWPSFRPARGNYQVRAAYRKAEIVCDLTRTFCRRFISRGDRTNDQNSREARFVQIVANIRLKVAEGRRAAEAFASSGW